MDDRHRRVLLLGDSLRIAYQPEVDRLLREEGIEVVGPAASTGDSVTLADGIDEWLDRFSPDAVHFNAGLEDVRFVHAEGRNAVSIGDYGRSLTRVVDACKSRLGGDVIFALTTPVNDEVQCGGPGAAFDRCNRDIEEYNIAAQELMLAENVLINHLDRVIIQRDDEFLAKDGASLTPAGVSAAAGAVADAIRSLWH